MTDAYNVTAEELASYVQRIEAQNERIAEETKARKEIYVEAVARGYDGRVLRKIVALRKRRPDEISEEEAVLELYKKALGMV